MTEPLWSGLREGHPILTPGKILLKTNCKKNTYRENHSDSLLIYLPLQRKQIVISKESSTEKSLIKSIKISPFGRNDNIVYL